MSNENLQQLLNTPAAFLAEPEKDGNVAVFTRIRLARNISTFPFPCAAHPEQLPEICELVTAAAGNCEKMNKDGCLSFDIAEMTPADREILKERFLVGKEILSGPENCRLLTGKDSSCSILINDEDHLRIQILAPGFQLDQAWVDTDALDNALSAHLDYAFDDQLGFLTSSPANTGTGLKASVLLHLPGLVMTGKLGPTIQGVNKLNLAFRGLYGEPNENPGNLFLISNQVTLGDSETGIIGKLSQVVRQLILHENAARQLIIQKDQAALLDHVGRSYGILRHGFKLSVKEALNCLSGLRLGVDMKLFSHVDMNCVNEMFLTVQPVHLQKYAEKNLSAAERDVFRAEYCREKFKK